MCTCLSKTSALLTEELIKRNANIGTVSKIEANNIGILQVGSQLVTQPILTYEYHLARRKKDGSEGKPTKQSINITFTYCPFCGTKYEQD